MDNRGSERDCGIFEEQGRPVKFFIQKDLPESTINELTVQITANGGSVEDKVPLHGFVVVEPASGEGKRLHACWSTADRPRRCFVPPTFVLACLQAGKLLPQPFRDPIRAQRKRIHIHPSIKDEHIINTLSAHIWNSGGDPTAAESEADVIIVEEDSPVFQELILRCDHTRHKFVESPGWVEKCVQSGIFRNTPSIKKNLGGRVKGSSRTEFSGTDDRNLALYLASRLPDPTMRGRTGNKAYQDLCSQSDLYPWSARHPWQSWRERYKNNTGRFDHLINSFVKQNPASPDGKGLHGFVRATTKGRKSTKRDDRAEEKNSPALDADRESQWEVRVGHRSPPAWGKGKRRAEEFPGSPEKRHKTRAEDGESTQVPPIPLQSSITGESRLRTSVDAQETTEPGQQTNANRSRYYSQSPSEDIEKVEASLVAATPRSGQIGLGDETQELLTANQDMLASVHCTVPTHSRVEATTQELTNFLVSPRQHSEANPNTIDDIAADAGDVLWQIASKYRFVIDEVKEIYAEQQGDLERTIAFFKEVRREITEKRFTWKLAEGRQPGSKL